MLMENCQQEQLVCTVSAVGWAEFSLNWILEFCRNALKKGGNTGKPQISRFALAEVEILKRFINQLTDSHMAGEDVIM